MHEARSQIMYSSIFSWGENSLSHSLGKAMTFVSVTPVTWKSLKIACPHLGAPITGVSNVKCSTSELPKKSDSLF